MLLSLAPNNKKEKCLFICKLFAKYIWPVYLKPHAKWANSNKIIS